MTDPRMNLPNLVRGEPDLAKAIVRVPADRPDVPENAIPKLLDLIFADPPRETDGDAGA